MGPSCPPGRGFTPERKGHQAGHGAWFVLRDSGKRAGVFPRGLTLCVQPPHHPPTPGSPTLSLSLSLPSDSLFICFSLFFPLPPSLPPSCQWLFSFHKSQLLRDFHSVQLLGGLGQARPGQARLSHPRKRFHGNSWVKNRFGEPGQCLCLARCAGIWVGSPVPRGAPSTVRWQKLGAPPAGPPVGKGPDFMNNSFTLSVILGVCQAHALK